MKRICILLLASLMLLSFAACKGPKSQESTSSSSSSTSSSDTYVPWIYKATESEKEEKVGRCAAEETLRSLSSHTNVQFDKSQTRYKIGTARRTNTDKNGGEDWYVAGTVYLYDKYGSSLGSAKFEQELIYLFENGSATRLGHYEIIYDGKTYHN